MSFDPFDALEKATELFEKACEEAGLVLAAPAPESEVEGEARLTLETTIEIEGVRVCASFWVQSSDRCAEGKWSLVERHPQTQPHEIN